jgi:hypothetical protein
MVGGAAVPKCAKCNGTGMIKGFWFFKIWCDVCGGRGSHFSFGSRGLAKAAHDGDDFDRSSSSWGFSSIINYESSSHSDHNSSTSSSWESSNDSSNNNSSSNDDSGSRSHSDYDRSDDDNSSNDSD